MIKHQEKISIVKRYFHGIDDNFFLFGPRGTGKSTWVKKNYPNALILELLNNAIYRQYQAYPERLKDLVLANPDRKTIVIDEIQKIPELLSVLHEIIELKTGQQFILTGSSARKLKRTGVDLLGGRAQVKYLHPFMASEISDSFNIIQNLKLGMVPLILNSNDPIGRLNAYISLYMQEEVQQEGLVRKIEFFSRFLEVISFSQASVLNYSNIARECHIGNKTVENYIEILEDLLLSFRLNIFEKRAKRELTKAPKFYYFDCGVFQSVRPLGPLDITDEIGGHALETLVAQHLQAWLDYSNQQGKLYFWRTKSGVEVDFIIYGEIGFYAIEVKSTNNLNPKDFRGLQEFKHDYPESTCIMLYAGKEKILVNDIICIPVSDFLLNIIPNQKLI